MSFEKLGLSADTVLTLKTMSIETPTPVQEQAIPLLLDGKDVIAQAQTGTGKTAAFALPLLERLSEERQNPQILVLAPTRELAMQVAENFQQYAPKSMRLNIACLVGGASHPEQKERLKPKRGKAPQVVIGTPGRVMDHMRRGNLNLTSLKAFVLDEADEMLRMGFIEDVEWVLEHLPEQRQMALFSATMPDRIRQIAVRFLNAPSHVTIKAKTATVSSVEQRFLFASFPQKLDALLRILETETHDAIIVFTRTKQLTEEVSQQLQLHGYRAKAINGDIPQAKRIQAVEEIKKGRSDILVATDVAARGLDIERISLVINYDIPFDAETYVHRIGRTGRAGRSGQAILFVTPKESRALNSLERATKQKITKMGLPSDEQVNKIRNQLFLDKLSKQITSSNLHQQKELIKAYQEEHDLDLLDIAAALVRLNVKPLKPMKAPKHVKSEHSSTRRIADERPRKERKPKNRVEKGMLQENFRLEVGTRHGVKARNIVGAIANEAGIDSQFIDDLTIYDDYSTVKLPQGIPKKIYKDLKKAWVCGQQLNISRVD